MIGISLDRVEDDSMSPLIPQGSYVFFHRFFFKKQLALGDLVKVNHPKFGVIIKSITFKDRNGFYWLSGEKNASLSTLDMGPIKSKMIMGKACTLLRCYLLMFPLHSKRN